MSYFKNIVAQMRGERWFYQANRAWGAFKVMDQLHVYEPAQRTPVFSIKVQPGFWEAKAFVSEEGKHGRKVEVFVLQAAGYVSIRHPDSADWKFVDNFLVYETLGVTVESPYLHKRKEKPTLNAILTDGARINPCIPFVCGHGVSIRIPNSRGTSIYKIQDAQEAIQALKFEFTDLERKDYR